MYYHCRLPLRYDSFLMRFVAVTIITVVLIVLSCSFLSAAGPEMVGDFGRGIDPVQWETKGADGLFFVSQPDALLHFKAGEGKGQTLITKRAFGAGLFRLRFHDFNSDNKEAGGQSRGSFIALGLGPADQYVRIIRGAIRSGGYFEKNAIANTVFRKGAFTMSWVPTEARYGCLELYWDGTTVRTYVQGEAAAGDNRWQEIGSSAKPAWTAPPHLFISGYPGPASAGTTSVVIDSVEYWPLDATLPPHEPALPLPRRQSFKDGTPITAATRPPIQPAGRRG